MGVGVAGTSGLAVALVLDLFELHFVDLVVGSAASSDAGIPRRSLRAAADGAAHCVGQGPGGRMS